MENYIIRIIIFFLSKTKNDKLPEIQSRHKPFMITIAKKLIDKDKFKFKTSNPATIRCKPGIRPDSCKRHLRKHVKS